MKRQFFLVILAIVLVFVPSSRASQQSDDTSVLQTLQDYLRYASLNNAELKAKFPPSC